MGWKANCILVSTREDGFFGTFPNHDSALAAEIVEKLPLAKHRFGEKSTFERGMYPEPGQLVVGAYPGAAIIGHDELCLACFGDRIPRVVTELWKLFPTAKILAVLLHSVVNQFGYAFFTDGKMIRQRIGADGQATFEFGIPLPEEEPLFAKSILRDGRRVFHEENNGEIEEFTEDAFGEEFVFEVTKSFLGTRLDQFNSWELEMEIFTPVKRSLFARLFGQ